MNIRISQEEMLSGWTAILGEPIPGAEETLARLSARLPLYLFSNTNPAHFAHFHPRYGRLLSRFRETITSCDIGARKPEAEAFRRVAARIGAPPGRLAFFDDLQENVAGARHAGWNAWRVSRPGEILEALGA